jgi:hypothetical protein
MSDKIKPQHLARKAIVYVRQSSAHQVHHNLESQRLQYAMQDRLQQLGWREIDVVDDDLGRSAAGLVTRAGFARMVAKVCVGQVGAVAAREVSRFARNSREWQHLVEVCRVVDTVLIDLEAVYCPRLSNDRLLLGLNRPDSNSTSYSSSRRSANSVEIPPRVIAAFRPRLLGNLAEEREIPTSAHSHSLFLQKNKDEEQLQRRGSRFTRIQMSGDRGRSALDAVALVRRRSWDYDWVVEFDIKGLFDNIDHELLLRALRKHCRIPWVLLYVERWLTAPMETPEGTLVTRERGTRKGASSVL